MTDGPHEETVYARAPILVARGGDGSVHAFSPTQELAYRTEPGSGRILIVGADAQSASTAAARMAWEVVRAVLSRDGWTLLHASAVVRDGRAVLTFGLGLLDSLGLYDNARKRIQAGEQLHPTQDQRVTAALCAGDRTPLHEPGGRELKTQVFPDQLQSWFGLPLATGGHAAVLLFPTVIPGASATCNQQCRSLAEADFFSTKTEDRYPDIFGLALADSATRHQTRAVAHEQLARVPHYAVTLGHDITANIDVLGKIVVSV